MKLNNNSKGLLYAVGASLTWGLVAIIVKIILNYIPSETIAWSRFLIAFITLLIFNLITTPKSLKILIRPPLLVILSAIAICSNYLLFITGLKFTTPNNTAIFIQIGPILLAAAGFIFYKEKVNRKQLFGFALAILGFVLFYKEQLVNLLISPEIYNKGIVMIILAGVVWTIYSILQKELLKKYKTSELNLINFGLPAILLIPVIETEGFRELTPVLWILFLFLGTTTVVAYGCLSQALKYTEANKISIILTSNPVITLFAMAILTSMKVNWIAGEAYTLLTVAGAVLVISGAIIVSAFR